MDTFGKIFHVKFLGCAHWFMYIRISEFQNHFISVDPAKYATSVVVKYIYTVTIKYSQSFIRLPYFII